MIIIFQNNEYKFLDWSATKRGDDKYNFVRRIKNGHKNDCCIFYPDKNESNHIVYFDGVLLEIQRIFNTINGSNKLQMSIDDAKSFIDKFLCKTLKLRAFV